MVEVVVVTNIQAEIEAVFDAARDLGLHTDSASWTRERIVAGRSTGLAQLGDEITFEAIHFGVRQRLSSRITEMDPPNQFVDEMTKGAFRSMRHRHLFQSEKGTTVMTDVLEFAAPLGPLGLVAEQLFLRAYMRRFLTKRNYHLKRICEGRS